MVAALGVEAAYVTDESTISGFGAADTDERWAARLARCRAHLGVPVEPGDRIYEVAERLMLGPKASESTPDPLSPAPWPPGIIGPNSVASRSHPCYG